MSEVKPLPTEPWTVIEPQWKPGCGPSTPLVIKHAMTLHEDGHWRGLGWFRPAADLAAEIDGYKILAEPCDEHYGAEDLKRERSAGAQAALARVYEEYPPGSFTDLEGLRALTKEFEKEVPDGRA